MAQLSILVAQFGEDVPYAGGLDRGFAFRGTRVPYLNRQKGIYRASAQRRPVALSIQTSAKSPYDDEILADGFALDLLKGFHQTPLHLPRRKVAAGVTHTSRSVLILAIRQLRQSSRSACQRRRLNSFSPERPAPRNRWRRRSFTGAE